MLHNSGGTVSDPGALSALKGGERRPEAAWPPWSPALLTCSCVLFVCCALRFFNYVEDDAFIPMRYALNFWHGDGWVMNPGERVEGYTSPLQLWYLTLTLRFATPDQAVFLSKGLGLLLGVLVLHRTRALARLVLPDRRGWADAAPLLVALRPEFALSMTNALETGLATWFLTGGLVRLLEGAGGRRPGAAPWFLGAALARPELALTFPALLLLKAVTGRHGERRALWQPLLAYSLPLLLCLLFRITYYHDVLPNTFYAKHRPLAEAAPEGLAYLLAYGLPLEAGHRAFGAYTWSGPLLLAGLALVLAGLAVVLRRGRRPGVPLAALALHAAFLLASGGDWMIDGRFLTVVLPVWALVWAAGASGLVDLLAGDKPPSGAVPALAALLLGLAVAFDALPRAQRVAAYPFLRDIRSVARPRAPLAGWMTDNPQGRLRISQWVKTHVRPGQWVAASEMGLVPLQNPGVRFLDLRGLTDRRVAGMGAYPHTLFGVMIPCWRAPGGGAWEYLRERRPQWVISFDCGPGTEPDGSSAPYRVADTFPVTLDEGEEVPITVWRRGGPDAPSPAPAGSAPEQTARAGDDRKKTPGGRT